MLSYIIVVLVAVSVLEGLLITGVKSYYYNGISQALSKQAQYASSYYSSSLSGQKLEDASRDIYHSISSNISAEVQIINADGDIIYDSVLSSKNKNTSLPDIKKALEGYPGYYEGNLDNGGEKIMAAALPLYSKGEVKGAIRLISSLSAADETVGKIILILILLGAAALCAAGLTGFMISRAITRPIEEMTSAAVSMAEGKFETRVSVKSKNEIGRLGDTLNYLAGEAVRHERLKDEFIASVSHDLRTPLTSIKGWAVILKSGGLKDIEEVMEGLDMIEKESDRLSLMVEELLDFSKLESGRMKINTKDISLGEIMSYIKKQMEGRALRQGVDLLLECEEIPAVRGDELRLKQALLNIVDNSLKFTPPGGTIKLYCREFGNYAAAGVEDNGIGISEDDLPRVTERFFKGENSSGSGLGLSTASQIASLHGGRINIESTPGSGTRVEIQLPL